MKIIISERQLGVLKENFAPTPVDKEKEKTVEEEKEELADYFTKNGEYMIDITNGKKYVVQYLKGLSDLIGKAYGVCASLKNGEIQGPYFVKPYSTFKKTNANPEPTKINSNNSYQTPRKPNLYQQLMQGK